MAEKGIDYRVEYGNFVLFGHDCGSGCRQTNNAPDDRTFQVSVVTCRRAPLHGGIPVDTRGSASRMARLSPLGARFAPCGGAGWKLGFQFYRKKFTPAILGKKQLPKCRRREACLRYHTTITYNNNMGKRRIHIHARPDEHVVVHRGGGRGREEGNGSGCLKMIIAGVFLFILLKACG